MKLVEILWKANSSFTLQALDLEQICMLWLRDPNTQLLLATQLLSATDGEHAERDDVDRSECPGRGATP